MESKTCVQVGEMAGDPCLPETVKTQEETSPLGLSAAPFNKNKCWKRRVTMTDDASKKRKHVWEVPFLCSVLRRKNHSSTSHDVASCEGVHKLGLLTCRTSFIMACPINIPRDADDARLHCGKNINKRSAWRKLRKFRNPVQIQSRHNVTHP